MDHLFENIYIDAAADFSAPGQVDARLLEYVRAGIEVVVSFRESEPLATEYRLLNIDYHHIPIIDFDVPLPNSVASFIEVMERNRGRTILLHCLAGLGRSGTMAALYLKYRGMSGAEAVRYVRERRWGAVQTREQEDFVLNYPFDGLAEDA
ncbi:MAG: dual specificity protein phosphatase family protein [Acidobacteria bacterium]|nr:dual specificity protein phosphatase family protein [Acidobacteriota bacterium]